MKKHFTLLATTLFLLGTVLTASAQGEWKWAHYWSGGDGSYGDYFNKITNTAFDEEGNIYVYGIMGGNPTIDGMTFQFTQAGSVLGMNDKTILLAKFDTLGNMLWYKVVKNSTHLSFPLWMEVRNDKVYVAGNCAFTGDAQNSWTYYMDTLVYKYQCSSIPVEQQHPPFKPGYKWTFFAQLDLDGNLIEDHFVEAITRWHFWTGTDTIRPRWFLCENTISPVHICEDGSICVFTTIEYNDKEEYPYTIVVDEDTNKTYDLYFPGSTLPQNNIWNFIMFKFTPNWELDFAKLLVDHADGIAPIITEIEGTSDTLRDYISPFFHGMTFDEDDNMYLTGRLNLVQWMPGSGGELNNFPVHIWWDDNHHTTMDDISSAEQCSFILKYNPMGELLWNNQLHTLVQNSATDLALVEYRESTFDDNSIYVLGKCGCYNSGHIYFDNPQQTLVQNPNTLTNFGFFVRYNATTGEYQSHGIEPTQELSITRKPAIMNDRVLAITWHNFQKKLFLTTWRKDGTFIKNEKISDNSIVTYNSYGIQKKDDTHLAVLLQATGPISFGDNIFLNCPSGHSSAVIAYYYDPSLAEPLPEDSTGIAEHSVKVNVRLWPNPATDKITIESEDTFPIKSVCIADMQGTIVGILPVDDTHCTLNVSNLSAGTYIAHVETKAGISDCKFVVKR
ncbi:MAG: T9SS type A sorting domain-containing protein [Bacteroidales bacterium]|nr:T9SS type A sorting domain-containing protein [Bacteroidales bacterium]